MALICFMGLVRMVSIISFSHCHKLIFHQQWPDWKFTIWALLSTLTLGIIIARIFGFILDGLFAKQFLWLLIELVILATFSF
ncbi:hypothetical protein BFS30_20610 [Pedobacter steynii]|uniref:Uncharacterized protein n=1 Tax=Pedobacter steynii TaxID=430522 RepID=A0A1D7QL35_9SPHI|nr:hypothetical protein BFS30_20610 [Pedobacter steynii]